MSEGQGGLTRIPLKQRMMLLSLAAALATMGLKFIAWRLTGSVGLFSDAAESVVNLVAAGFGLFALRVSARPPDEDHAHGHHKVEYFASGLEGVLILVAAGSIGWAAIGRLIEPEPLSGLGLGLGISLVATVINGVVSMAMMRVARREDSIVLEADAHHLMTDVWTSVGILAGLGVVALVPGAVWLDPVIALAVALNITRVGLVLLQRSVDGLMDRALPEREQEQIREVVLAELPIGSRLSELRTSRAGSVRFITFNLLLPGSMSVEDSHALCDRAEALLESELAPCRVTIHVEPLPPEPPRPQTR